MHYNTSSLSWVCALDRSIGPGQLIWFFTNTCSYNVEIHKSYSYISMIRVTMTLEVRGVFNNLFSYFSKKTYVVGTHWLRLNETRPISHTTNVFT